MIFVFRAMNDGKNAIPLDLKELMGEREMKMVAGPMLVEAGVL